MYEYSIMNLLSKIAYRILENMTFWKKVKPEQNDLPMVLRSRPIPKSTSNTIKFRRYERLDLKNNVPLTPGETPSLSMHGDSPASRA
jgi:hypothetical protein